LSNIIAFLIMESLAHTEIRKLVRRVKGLSINGNNSPLSDEKHIDDLLDTINSFKRALSEKTAMLNEINERIEKLRWFNAMGKEYLALMNDLITSARGLHTPLKSQYNSLESVRRQGIAENEIDDFKNSINELKKSYLVLETVFFCYYETQGINETRLTLN
jgi:chromosome segregation ATPase